MHTKRLISYVLIFAILITTALPTLSFAQTTPVITVESVVDAPGSQVEVGVSIENNPGILGATLGLTFGDGLTLTGAQAGDAFTSFTLTKPGKLVSPCNFAWVGIDADYSNGTILTLQFTIDEDAPNGSEYDVCISYQDGDVVDGDLNPVSPRVVNGKVSVVDYLPGDLDGNKRVNIVDAILLSRHIAGGYEITINESAADVNADQRINIMDAILLSRYIAGGYDVVLKPSKPQCTHTMQNVSYKAPTCTEDGNIIYWQCTKCNKCFSDENGTSSIALTDTVLPSTGHTVVIDPAIEATPDSTGLTEGKHCSVCDTVLVPQEVVPKLEKNEYSITYHMHHNDNYLESIAIENPNPVTYSKEDGLVLQDLIVKGYNFVGWFTAQTGGTQVTQIPAGSTGNKTLYAHWEKVVYTVQFESTMVPQASFTYTTGQEKTLPSPRLDRYTFVGWSDKDGKMWSTIPVGTAQDLILYANWSSNRNQAVAVDTLDDPIICEDSESGLILFTYEIGEIRNVPLYEIMRLNCVNGIISSVSTTVSEEISTTQAETIAQTISNATTNSSSWTLENNWNNSTEVSQTYLDQTNQSREDVESLAKSESGTYNLSSSNGGNSSTVVTEGGSYKKSENNGKTNTNTTEKGQDVALSVDAKVHAGVEVPIEVVKVNAGYEISGGADYSNYGHKTNTGTKEWSATTEDYEYDSNTTTDEKIWNTSEGYSNSKVTSTNSTIANAISKLISQEYGYGSSYAEGGSNSQSQALASTETKNDEFSATMTYHTSKIQSVTKTIETTGETFGDYRYVMAGTVHVFAVIGYDVAESTYFVYTYNVLDDHTYEYVDYSFDESFNDYETSIIPFEVPYFVNEYVNARIAKTDGLLIDPDTGIIEGYTPTGDKPDNFVYIPSYITVDNGHNDFIAVKVKGIAPGLFKNNKDIVGISLGSYITEIPTSAFEGCSSLKYVFTPGVTKIGDNAFKGCTSLENFVIPIDVIHVGQNAFEGVKSIETVASNSSVAASVSASGAQNIVLDISSANDISNTDIKVGNITSFELLGKDKEYSGLTVESNADTTVINGIKFVDCAKTPMKIGSENITLNRISATAQGLALVLTADNAKVKLNQNISLSSALGDAVLCKDVTLSALSTSVVGKMILNGNMLVAGSSVGGNNLLNFNSGEIKYITDDEFDNYTDGCIVNFDANGGRVAITSKMAAFNTAVGELPLPAYGDYTFLGWYTAKNGGKKITSETIIDSGSMTVYAKWNNWDGTSTEPIYNASTKTYTITNGNELAWISDVSNGLITTGENFPNDITFTGYTIELANDIYLNDTTNWEDWKTSTPVNIWSPIDEFFGTFCGNNHTIYGLFEQKMGMFKENNGYINELNINKSLFSGLVRLNKGDINYCTVYGNLRSPRASSIGGIAQSNQGNISSCINNAYILLSADNAYVGGIAGYNRGGEIQSCKNNSSIAHQPNVFPDSAGGIVGCLESGTIMNCENGSTISSESGSSGGVVGSATSHALISHCRNYGKIESKLASDAGGILGAGNSCRIENCYNRGALKICGDSYSNVGGIAGAVGEIEIINCYNRAACFVERGCVGGIVGSGMNIIVTKVYSNGLTEAQSGYYADLFGELDDGSAEYCYGTRTPLYGNLINSPSLTSVENISGTKMKTLSNLTGFSSSVWATNPNINDGYPYLIALEDTY